MDEGDKADRGNLPRYLRDPNRPAKLVGRLAADNDATNVRQRPIDDEPGFLRAHPNRLRRRYRLKFQVLRRHRSADAENSDPMNVAKIVLDLPERRRRVEHERRAFAIDLDREHVAGALADNALHIGEVID